MKEIILKSLEKLGLKDIKIEVPSNMNLGDYAVPCFSFSKELKKAPNVIAQELSVQLNGKIKGTEIRATGSYLNFFIDKSKFSEETLKEIHHLKEKYGSLKVKEKALIEHTSINPNASPHLGRARNAIIGDCLTRILKFHGYKTTVRYFVNDSGKQIAVLVLGCENRKPSFNELLQIYVDTNKRLENNLEMEQEVFALLKDLEKGDKKIKERFRNVVNLCIQGQSKILGDLGITYDNYDFESDYIWNNKMKKILDKLKETGKVFTDTEGREVMDLSEFDVPVDPKVFVLTRSDGTSLYGLRDISYHADKEEWAGEGRNILVLGEDQKAYFKQLESALTILKIKAPEVVHYSFVLLKDGKMSTRKGNLVLLEEFMNEALRKSQEEIVKRYEKGNEKLAKAIGYGAVKYSILKVSSDKNVIFDWDSALAFEGDSSPYIQYSHARSCSILEKAEKEKHKINTKINFSVFKTKEEQELISMLANFKVAAEEAMKKLRPVLIATYSYELAKQFNDFYHKCQCITDDKEITSARLLLVDCFRQVLANSLSLLGIEAVKSM